jgi:hypothetical protein
MARQELFKIGIKALRENWIMGMPLAELWSETPGEYLHNYLSFWVCFGILPFAGFIGLSINCIVKLITLLKKHPLNSLNMFLATYFIFVYIEIIISRAYVYPYVWACLSAVPVIYNHYSINKSKLIDNVIW